MYALYALYALCNIDVFYAPQRRLLYAREKPILMCSLLDTKYILFEIQISCLVFDKFIKTVDSMNITNENVV